jgi:cytochrome bd ubiquinol oxidase subunit I
MELDPTLLSRIQFAFVITFHILFPSFTIGLASFIAMLEGLWLFRKRQYYLYLSRFWTRIFAISFGMGVVSGVVMSYQFGTNWARFSAYSANVMGPLLAYEVQTAFFLEATFLGILLFARNRVPKPLLAFSALMVAIGTLISAFWILSANSWMQTPDGYELRDGLIQVTDWWRAIFNPSFPYRFAHMVVACFVTTGFVVVAVNAWFLLRGNHKTLARYTLSITLWLLTLLVPLQIFLGDQHGLNTLEYQPSKVAAMEGHWETEKGAPILLFAIPDQEKETNHFEIAIPKLGSLILTHSLDGTVPGLKNWPPQDRPHVATVFWAFRVMVGCGVLMLAIVLWSVLLRRRKRLFDNPLFLRTCVLAGPIGFIAVVAGWFTTETGRQPWLIFNVMRTMDGASPGVPPGSVLLSLALYVATYAIVFGAGVYFILQTVRQGPR